MKTPILPQLASLVCLLLFLAVEATPAYANSVSELLKANRELLEAAPFVAENFSELPRESLLGMDAAAYKRCVDSLPALHVDFFRLRYRSDSLAVVGLAAFPKNFDPARRYPVVVYNRGGNREFGRITACALRTIAERYANNGEYILFAPQYRGVAGGEGREEFGGADVEDVLALLRIARGYSFTDAANAFLIGHSRGGMMTYLALKAGAEVNAAVVSAGPSDLLSWEKERPEMGREFAELIPGLERNRAELLKQRSAVYWAGKLAAPLLILHGTSDERVGIAQAEAMHRELERAGHPHRFVKFPNEGHHFSGAAAQVKAEIQAWLKAHWRP